MAFYHEKKEHMSPSAMATWFTSKANFVKSYFEGEKGPTTKAMEGGTVIHRLIEAGLIPAKHVYAMAEPELKFPVPGSDYFFMGRPDSCDEVAKDDAARFVDYKSGKANDWVKKLPTDLKMKATAWLVWMQTGKPSKVFGAVEFIATTWDPETRSVVPIEGIPTEEILITYQAEDLEAFTGVIVKTMDEVNAFYEKWGDSTSEFVSEEDVDRYIALEEKREAIVAEQDEIKERLQGQMEFGGILNHKDPRGTFYLTEKATYSYPKDLSFEVVDPATSEAEMISLEKAGMVDAAAKAAKKNYELVSEPVSTSTSIGFRKPTKRGEKKADDAV